MNQLELKAEKIHKAMKNDRCGHKDRKGYCSKKNIIVSTFECYDCWCFNDSETMQKEDWNWTDGFLNEELSE